MHIGNTKAWVGTNTVQEMLLGSYPIPVSKGGTGVTSLSSLKDSLGISSSSGISNIEYKCLEWEIPDSDETYIKTLTASFSFTIKAAIILWWINSKALHIDNAVNYADILTAGHPSASNSSATITYSDRTITISVWGNRYGYYVGFQIVAFG